MHHFRGESQIFIPQRISSLENIEKKAFCTQECYLENNEKIGKIKKNNNKTYKGTLVPSVIKISVF